MLFRKLPLGYAVPKCKNKLKKRKSVAKRTKKDRDKGKGNPIMMMEVNFRRGALSCTMTSEEMLQRRLN